MYYVVQAGLKLTTWPRMALNSLFFCLFLQELGLHMCTTICVYHYLCVPLFVCTITCVYHHLCVTLFVCTVTCVYHHLDCYQVSSQKTKKLDGQSDQRLALMSALLRGRQTCLITIKRECLWRTASPVKAEGRNAAKRGNRLRIVIWISEFLLLLHFNTHWHT